MDLTPAQRTAVKTFITNDPTMNARPNTTDGAKLTEPELNALAVPDYIVWRTDIRAQEVVNAIVGTEYAALTAIKQNLLTLLLMPGSVDGSKPNIQADFSAIFSAGATLTALSALAKRKANVVEKILATGTGSTASPATMGFEGPITFDQIDAARHS